MCDVLFTISQYLLWVKHNVIQCVSGCNESRTFHTKLLMEYFRFGWITLLGDTMLNKNGWWR